MESYEYEVLCQAIRAKDFELAKVLLSAGVEVNPTEEEDDGEEAPLILALKFGAGDDVIRAILEGGADIEREDEDGEMPLIVALDQKNVEAAKLILSKTEDIYTIRSDGATPLHLAVELGCEELVDICLKRQMYVDIEDGQRRTALHLAAKWGRESIVKLLLSRGANLHETDRYGRTALHYSSLGGHLSVLCRLIDYEGNVDWKDNNGRTCLHDASWLGHVDVVGLLLNCHANVNAKDGEGLTAVHHAAMRGHDLVVSALLERGADLSVQDKEGRTPLHHAILRGCYDMIKLLFESGDDLVTPDFKNRSPLVTLLSTTNSTTAFHLNGDLKLSELIVKHSVRAMMMTVGTVCVEHFQVLRAHMTVERWNDLQRYIYDCEEEINKMKYADNPIFAYEILTRNLRFLMRVCSENEETSAVLDSIECNRLYPIYGDFLAARVQKANAKNDLRASGKQSLRFVVNRALPHVIRFPDIPCDIIMKSFTDIDIANLVEACRRSPD